MQKINSFKPYVQQHGKKLFLEFECRNANHGKIVISSSISNNNTSNEKRENLMGCATFTSEEKTPPPFAYHPREMKKSQKIDCRKKSSQNLDLIRENVVMVAESLTEAEKQFACKCLKQHSLFCTLEDYEIMEIVNLMQRADAARQEYIFREGETGVCFFLIKEGEVEVEINQSVGKTLVKGDAFGELALLYYSKRTASIKTKSEKVELILIKSKPFKAVMRKIREANNERTRNLIENVQIFSLLTTKQKYTMLNCLVREQYKKGTVLFKKNDIPVSFYIIESGKVSLVFNNPTKTDIVLGSLESFGENAFKSGAKREGTATVEEDLVCLTINEEKMKECLGGTLSNIVYHNIKKWAIKSSPIFHGFDNKEIDQIAMQFAAKFGKTNDLIMDMERPVDSIVICIEGKINSKPPGTIFNDEYFNKKGNLHKDIIKNDDGVYAIMSFDRLREIIEIIHTKGSVALAKKRKSVLAKENENVLPLEGLDYLIKLGEGQFGEVHLVRDRSSGNLFALKCLDKGKIKKESMEESAISEREILSSICHPLIVGFYKAYQDHKNIYFLLEYIYGMEMFEAIREIGILNKTIARFYFGSLLMSIEYLHSRNIIYRDIKPENSIVDNQGKVYLIDMGTAKQLKSQNGYRTDTIIGTPHYMAPEVMQGKGYSFEADYWSLGVLFYELICGHLPFAETIDNPYQVYAEIMKTQLSFPSFVTDEPSKVIIKKLLTKNIQTRSLGGLTSIRNLPYFDGFNWDDLYQGKMTPPYVPKKFKNSNTSKYAEMQGSPLTDFLGKNQGKGSHQINLWITNDIQ